MTEKVCLITGATDGIGKATAIQLHSRGYRVVIVARNMKKVASLLQEIGLPDSPPKLDYLLADLSSLSQVNEMLEAFKQKYQRLDILINNAGVVMPTARLTEDGFETTFQVNYLSPFVITNSLLEHLGKSDDGRIINVTSSVYTLGKFDPANIYAEGRYSAIEAYSTSKLYLLLFTEALAGKIGGITANAMHPGIVKTNMSTQVQGFPFLFKVISFIALPFAISPEKAASASLYLATSDSVRHVTGKYFVNSKIVETSSRFNTPDNRQKLWDLSLYIWNSKK